MAHLPAGCACAPMAIEVWAYLVGIAAVALPFLVLYAVVVLVAAPALRAKEAAEEAAFRRWHRRWLAESAELAAWCAAGRAARA